MKRSLRLTQEFTRTLNPKLERFIRVNPTAAELIRKKPSLGPQNGEWLKRASFIGRPGTLCVGAAGCYAALCCARGGGVSSGKLHTQYMGVRRMHTEDTSHTVKIARMPMV